MIKSDVIIGNKIIEVKIGAFDLRNLRNGLLTLAYDLVTYPNHEGILLLTNAIITRERLLEEWESIQTVFQGNIFHRLSICLEDDNKFIGIPLDPDIETQNVLRAAINKVHLDMDRGKLQSDSTFVINKILLLQWMTSGKPITAEWLGRVTGYSFPTVSKVLKDLGSLIEKRSDRRFGLRLFSNKFFDVLLAKSFRARSTIRYAVSSEQQPLSMESYVNRLTNMNVPNIALGGVFGAKHYVPELDLVGQPRLDISIHSPKGIVNQDFIRQLDPALEIVTDPLKPASVILHKVKHVQSFFTQSDNHLNIADPVECLLDLHEAQLIMQANQFLNTFKQKNKY